MKCIEYIKLSLSCEENRSLAEQERFANLDREDERIGDTIAQWEIPGLLLFGAICHLLIGLAFLAFG